MTSQTTNRRQLPANQDELGWGFEGARRFHAQQGLMLTHAERLQWLDETVAEMRELCGRAREGFQVQDLASRSK
jgi:hypothetical protein